MKCLSGSRLLSWSLSASWLLEFCPLSGFTSVIAIPPPVKLSDASKSESPAALDIKRQGPTQKRRLLWDYTNTQQIPHAMDNINFNGPITAVSNWNVWTPPELRNRAAFRPTVRSEAQLYGAEWNIISETNEPIIHFFSEPEKRGISAAQAASLWKSHMIPLRQQRGKRLVSPSTANDPTGRAWMTEFMSYIADAPPDFLGVNYFGLESSHAVDYLESVHRQFPGYPIIVTEIASTARGKEQVTAFTAEMTNWMDRTPWIFEYGWFGAMTQLADGHVSPDARLMNPDGSFTELMNKLMYEQPLRV